MDVITHESFADVAALAEICFAPSIFDRQQQELSGFDFL